MKIACVLFMRFEEGDCGMVPQFKALEKNQITVVVQFA